MRKNFMKNQFTLRLEKKAKKPINGKPIELTFKNIDQVHRWVNELRDIVELKQDIALLHYAIDKQNHIKGSGCVPLKTSRRMGADTVVVLDFEPNQYKVQYGIMTPEMARIFNK